MISQAEPERYRMLTLFKAAWNPVRRRTMWVCYDNCEGRLPIVAQRATLRFLQCRTDEFACWLGRS
jgi:hypothetical protein